MKKHSTLILLLVFAVLAGAIAIQYAVGRNVQKELSERRPLFRVNPEDITVIEVERGENTFVINKSVEQWKIGTYDAIPSFIENVFSAIDSANIVSVAADTLEKKAEFGLSENDRTVTTFTFRKGVNVLGTYTAGIVNGRDGEVYYVIRDGENSIYRVNGLYGNLFYDELRSALAEKSEKDAITKVVVTTKTSKLEAEKKENVWYVNKRIAKTEKIDDFLNRVSRITADGFIAENDPAQAFDTMLAIHTKDAVLTLELGTKIPNTLYYLKNSQGVVYLLAEPAKQKLIRDYNYFFN